MATAAFLLLGGLRSRRELDVQLEAFFDSEGSGRFILDRGRRVVRANQTAHEMFAQRTGELVGRSIREFLTGESQENLDKAFQLADSSRSSSPPTRIELASEQGPGGAYEVVISRLPEKAGGGYSVFARDLRVRDELVAALAERGAELARSNRDLAEFAHVASHDLQEPLRMVRSFTELVSQRYTGQLDPQADQYLAFAQEGATRMQALLEALVTYARIDSRGRPFAPVSMETALSHAIDNLRLAIRDADATIDHDRLPDVEGDETQLMQVFQNLIDNAIKFRGTAPPHVTVRGLDEGAYVHYSVADNGIGIAPEHREKVFVIFERLHPRERYPGTGIGLAVCKRVVERHGGTIWVDEGALGGSVFHFRLPKWHPSPLRGADPSAINTVAPGARQQAEELITDRLKELV